MVVVLELVEEGSCGCFVAGEGGDGLGGVVEDGGAGFGGVELVEEVFGGIGSGFQVVVWCGCWFGWEEEGEGALSVWEVGVEGCSGQGSVLGLCFVEFVKVADQSFCGLFEGSVGGEVSFEEECIEELVGFVGEAELFGEFVDGGCVDGAGMGDGSQWSRGGSFSGDGEVVGGVGEVAWVEWLVRGEVAFGRDGCEQVQEVAGVVLEGCCGEEQECVAEGGDGEALVAICGGVDEVVCFVGDDGGVWR